MLNLKYSVQYMFYFVTHLPYQLNFDFADWEQNKSLTVIKWNYPADVLCNYEKFRF